LRRDPAIERQVFGQVDFAHSTGAKLVEDAVVGERLSACSDRICSLGSMTVPELYPNRYAAD
jgi:hypothetical protein